MINNELVTLDTSDLQKVFHIARSSVAILIKRPDFPKPVKAGRKNLWFKSEVLEYLEKSRSKVLSDLED